MHGGGYACRLEFFLHLRPLRHAHGVLRKYAAALCPLRHAGNASGIAQAVVARAQLLALCHFPVKTLQLGQHHGALQGVHAATHAHAGVGVAPALTMNANFAAGLRQGIVTGKDGAPIAIATQRFAGEKTGAPQCAEVAALLAVVLGAKALRRIFNHGQVAVLGGNGVNGVHISRLAIQAHRHDGAGAWRDGSLDLRGINQAGVGFHIHPHRRAAQQHNHFGCCCKGKRRGDDFIARLQVQRHEADEQSLGAAGYGDAMLGARARGQRGFQLGHFRPHDVLAVLQHALHALGNACLQCGILGFEVDEFHASLSFKVCLQAAPS